MSKKHGKFHKPAQRREYMQNKMVELLATGLSQQATADTLKVSLSTLKNWLKLPDMADRIVEEVDILLKEELGLIIRACKMKALNGSSRHAKITLDWLSKSMDRREKVLKDKQEKLVNDQQLEFLWKEEQ